MRWLPGCALVVVLVSGAGCDGGDHEPLADASQAQQCAACGPDQLCVQVMHSNGVDLCQSLSVACEPRDPRCTGTACSADCDFWQCCDGVDAGMLSCAHPVAVCPNAIAGALQCWGP